MNLFRSLRFDDSKGLLTTDCKTRPSALPCGWRAQTLRLFNAHFAKNRYQNYANASEIHLLYELQIIFIE